MSPAVSRRSLVWSVPVIAATSPAPAFAASHEPIDVQNHGYVTLDASTITIDGTSSSRVNRFGLTYKGPVTSLRGVSVSFWFRTRRLEFNSRIDGWTDLVRTGARRYDNRRTYYQYTSRYSAGGDVPTTPPFTQLPYWFQSRDGDGIDDFITTSSSTVNGTDRTTDSGVVDLGASNARSLTNVTPQGRSF